MKPESKPKEKKVGQITFGSHPLPNSTPAFLHISSYYLHISRLSLDLLIFQYNFIAFLAIDNSHTLLLHLFQASKTVSSQQMWDVLRRAVKSGSYKGEYLPSESAMYWESIFSPGASSVEGQRFVSAPTSPVKSPDFAYFSGPGPPTEHHDETSEEEEVEEVEEREDFPTEESEFDSSANEQESDDRPMERPQSPPIKTVQLSPAPEEYYRIVPITPYKDKGEAP